jgi:hypothetical protein
MSLPNEKRKPIRDLSREIIFIYGIPKIGKSSFAASMPDALFLSTEQGLNHLEVFDMPINNWVGFLAAISELEAEPTKYKTIVIDTADNLFMFLRDFTYNKLGIKHESDAEYGKGWDIASGEFRKQVTRVSKLGTGLVFISHSTEKEIQKGPRKGEVKVTHTLPTRARQLIQSMADMILYMEIDDDGNRVIRTKETVGYEAGDRTGRLPDTLPLDYEAFCAAYYGDGGRTELVAAIRKGLEYLDKHEIDSFNVPRRVVTSMEKHLKATNLEDQTITISALSAYLQHLRVKCQGQKKEKQDVEGLPGHEQLPGATDEKAA